VSFTRETLVKSVRKRHVCDGCGRHIQIGGPASRWAGMTDGDFGTAIYHPDCRAAEVELNDNRDWRYGDDWWPLGEIEHEEWPWLIESYPAVAERIGFVLPDQPASQSEAVAALRSVDRLAALNPNQSGEQS
jgi:hypothetical protein